MVSPTASPSPRGGKGLDYGDYRKSPRSRRRSPSIESDRKRRRADRGSYDPAPRSRSYYERGSWDRDRYESSRRHSYHHPSSKYGSMHSNPYSYDRSRGGRGYENGGGAPGMAGNGTYGMYQPRPAAHMQQVAPQQNSKSRRLYIGNIPYQAGLTDVALTQFFSALYVAGFRPNRAGEPLPVVSFWLHSDGKFGFMELRGEQEAVNMMQFNGVFLHGRPLRVNRPSDYRPEVHNPAGMNLVPDAVNTQAVMDLCNKLGGIVAAPAQLAAVAASEVARQKSGDLPAPLPVNLEPPAVQVGRSPEPPTRSQMPPEQKIAIDDNGPAITKNTPAERELSDRSVPDHPPVPARVDGGSPGTTALTSTKGDCVISLKDVVTGTDLDGDDEDYQQLIEEFEEECTEYGKVRSVVIPKTGSWRGTVFVEFDDNDSARAAVGALSKRVFDNRLIEASVIAGCATASEAANRPRS